MWRFLSAALFIFALSLAGCVAGLSYVTQAENTSGQPGDGTQETQGETVFSATTIFFSVEASGDAFVVMGYHYARLVAMLVTYDAARSSPWLLTEAVDLGDMTPSTPAMASDGNGSFFVVRFDDDRSNTALLLSKFHVEGESLVADASYTYRFAGVRGTFGEVDSPPIHSFLVDAGRVLVPSTFEAADGSGATYAALVDCDTGLQACTLHRLWPDVRDSTHAGVAAAIAKCQGRYVVVGAVCPEAHCNTDHYNVTAMFQSGPTIPPAETILPIGGDGTPGGSFNDLVSTGSVCIALQSGRLELLGELVLTEIDAADPDPYAAISQYVAFPEHSMADPPRLSPGPDGAILTTGSASGAILLRLIDISSASGRLTYTIVNEFTSPDADSILFDAAAGEDAIAAVGSSPCSDEHSCDPSGTGVVHIFMDTAEAWQDPP